MPFGRNYLVSREKKENTSFGMPARNAPTIYKSTRRARQIFSLVDIALSLLMATFVCSLIY